MSEGAAAGAPGVVVAVAAAAEDVVDGPGAAGVVGGTDVAAGVAGTAAAGAGAFLACQHEERTLATIIAL